MNTNKNVFINCYTIRFCVSLLLLTLFFSYKVLTSHIVVSPFVMFSRMYLSWMVRVWWSVQNTRASYKFKAASIYYSIQLIFLYSVEDELWLPYNMFLEDEKQRITVPHTCQSVANSGNKFIKISFSPNRMCSKQMTAVYSVNLKWIFRSNHMLDWQHDTWTEKEGVELQKL